MNEATNSAPSNIASNATPAHVTGANPDPNPAPDGHNIRSAEHLKVESWLREDYAAGKMTTDEYAAAMLELNEAHEEAPDTRTESQKTFDATFPPAKPEAYAFPPPQPGEQATPELRAADLTTRHWLSTALFSREHGSALAVEADRVARKIEHFSEAQHELFARSERQTLEKLWGADTEKNLSTARAFIREVGEKHPELIQMLNATGLGNSSSVIVQIYHQAERLMARNGEPT
ncbi:MAG: hypothetical protein LZF60_250003 [Nitrospira sp.]|nr:hypothetical protein [Nitrospira sp.]ULA60426.1 MAG: hypothetical protein LZF60_250003 [Nitrospira sp.]